MQTITRISMLACAAVASTIGLSAAQFTPVVPVNVVQFIPPPPDPCVSTQLQLNPQPWPSQNLTVLGESARLFEAGPDPAANGTPHDASLRPLVLVIDGNGFNLGDYDDMAEYLARKGFNVVVLDRPTSGPDPVDLALATLGEAFSMLGLPAHAPVGVIGHSMGGDIALDLVVENHANADSYNIEVAVLLAPKVSSGTATLVTASQLPALLVVYGSQDNDVGGLSTALTDGFAAYDRSGSEDGTTCHTQFCIFTSQMHRLMVYIHGADHSGLINETPVAPLFGNDWDPFNNYLSRSNQFCVAKAYTLAMLEWTLDDNGVWKNMVHGKHVPASIQAMTTASADELGNPAGSSVRVGLQVSPRKRSVIENFEDGAWSVVNKTPHVAIELVDEGDLAGSDQNVRHASMLGKIAWPAQNSAQLIGFSVPASQRDLTLFSHLALRLGQLADVADAAVANPPNSSPSLQIGLSDGASTRWVWTDPYGTILPADKRPNGQYQSAMSTIYVPLSAFSGLNKSKVQKVIIAFPAGTKGTLLVDNLEWVKE